MRAFLADTIALVIIFTAANVLNERFVAGMSWPEVWISRAIGQPLMILTAQPYGLWRDLVLARLPGPILLRDTAARLSSQVPISAAVVLAAGADLKELMHGLGGFAVILLVSARPYGLWLGFVRRRMDLPPGALKPMSLNGCEGT